MKSFLKMLWFGLCGLVLSYWISKSYFSPELQDAYKAESQGVLLASMIILTFPSGIVWYLLFVSVLSALDIFNIARPIFIEILLLWIGFAVVGYLQWFRYGPHLMNKFKQWRNS